MAEYNECETAGYEQPSQMPAKSVKQSFVIGGAAFDGCRGCRCYCPTVSVYVQQYNYGKLTVYTLPCAFQGAIVILALGAYQAALQLYIENVCNINK